MASALWLGSMEPQWLAPFLSLPVQVMVTPEMMVPVLPGQRFFTPSETLYIAGGEVRCSVWEEDYLPLLERLGRL